MNEIQPNPENGKKFKLCWLNAKEFTLFCTNERTHFKTDYCYDLNRQSMRQRKAVRRLNKFIVMEWIYSNCITFTFNDSSGRFLNATNFCWLCGNCSKNANRIASPESIGFFAGIDHVCWMADRCSGVNVAIVGITVNKNADSLAQEILSPISISFFFCPPQIQN